MKHAPTSDEHRSIHLLYRVGRLLRQKSAEFLRSANPQLSPEQWGIIRQLTIEGPLNLSKLADPHLDDRPNITRMVDALERHGLVERMPDPTDRRKKLVQLTEQGQALAENTLASMKAAKANIFRGLDAADTAQLLRTLQQLESNLTSDISENDDDKRD